MDITEILASIIIEQKNTPHSQYGNNKHYDLIWFDHPKSLIPIIGYEFLPQQIALDFSDDQLIDLGEMSRKDVNSLIKNKDKIVKYLKHKGYSNVIFGTMDDIGVQF